MTGRKTSLNVAEVRAQILLGALQVNPQVGKIEQIPTELPYFAMWGPDALAAAIDVLARTGRISQACDGTLCLHPRRRAA